MGAGCGGTPMKITQFFLRRSVVAMAALAVIFCVATAGLVRSLPAFLRAQEQKLLWNDREKPIAEKIAGLRALPDEMRAEATKNLALEIRQLPVTPNKLRLANSLANALHRRRLRPRYVTGSSDNSGRGAARAASPASRQGSLPRPTSNSPNSCATNTCKRARRSAIRRGDVQN